MTQTDPRFRVDPRATVVGTAVYQRVRHRVEDPAMHAGQIPAREKAADSAHREAWPRQGSAPGGPSRPATSSRDAGLRFIS